MLFHETPTTGPCADRAAAMQALVPVIETDRLILRAPVIEDFQEFARIVLGPQGRYFGHPKTREDAWGEFMQITGTWYLRGHGAWMITLRETGALIGVVLLGAEPGDTETELGYLLDA
ncbi:MAG: GNAT family N-acetyltransferase, partial [Pseudomonadota bacterium]